MDDSSNTDPPGGSDKADLSADPDRLLERYGPHLAGEEMTEAQTKEVLAALWHIMTVLVDLGFSLKPGDKFTPEAEIGMDDVLGYLIPEDPASATETPKNTNKNKEELS